MDMYLYMWPTNNILLSGLGDTKINNLSPNVTSFGFKVLPICELVLESLPLPSKLYLLLSVSQTLGLYILIVFLTESLDQSNILILIPVC